MIKEAEIDDLNDVLGLYGYLTENENYEDTAAFYENWKEIISDKKITCYIGCDGDTAVSTCIMTIIPNLTRFQRPYALIENVVTRPGYRGRGWARRVIAAAVEKAERANCYKVMLMSSSKRVEAHEFYKKIGFDAESKKAFQIRMI